MNPSAPIRKPNLLGHTPPPPPELPPSLNSQLALPSSSTQQQQQSNTSNDAGQTTGEPAKFITNTWRMLHDPTYAHLISWDLDGQSFSILDEQMFSQTVLPIFFKHANLPSFVRQLHTYGFRKHPRNRSTIATFSHEKFVKGRPELLIHISRKTIDSKTQIVRQRSEIQTMQDQIDLLRRHNGRLTEDIMRISGLAEQMADIIEQAVQIPEIAQTVNSLRYSLKVRVQSLQSLHQRKYNSDTLADSESSLFANAKIDTIGKQSNFPFSPSFTSNPTPITTSPVDQEFPSTFWSDFAITREQKQYDSTVHYNAYPKPF